jgi:hypothetical protein
VTENVVATDEQPDEVPRALMCSASMPLAGTVAVNCPADETT